jgi:hypothetical protein
MATLWNGQPFTCSNARYHTDTSKGFPHGVGRAGGSYFDTAVIQAPDGYSLWMEYVVDGHGPGAWQPSPIWLMWYDPQGNPTISQSATFDLSMVREIVTRFIV